MDLQPRPVRRLALVLASAWGVVFFFLTTFWFFLLAVPFFGTGTAHLTAPFDAGLGETYVRSDVSSFIFPATASVVHWSLPGMVADLALYAGVFAALTLLDRHLAWVVGAVTALLAMIVVPAAATAVPPPAGYFLYEVTGASRSLNLGAVWFVVAMITALVVAVYSMHRRRGWVALAVTLLLAAGAALSVVARPNPDRALAAATARCGHAPVIGNHNKLGARYEVPWDNDYSVQADSIFYCTTREAAAEGFQRVHFPATPTDPYRPQDCHADIPIQLDLVDAASVHVATACKRVSYPTACGRPGGTIFFLYAGRLADLTLDNRGQPGAAGPVAQLTVYGTSGPYDVTSFRGPVVISGRDPVVIAGDLTASRAPGHLRVDAVLPCNALYLAPGWGAGQYP